MGRPWKRWIDTMKECLRKEVWNVRQARRIAQDRSEWLGFVRGNAWGVAQGMNPCNAMSLVFIMMSKFPGRMVFYLQKVER